MLHNQCGFVHWATCNLLCNSYGDYTIFNFHFFCFPSFSSLTPCLLPGELQWSGLWSADREVEGAIWWWCEPHVLEGQRGDPAAVAPVGLWGGALWPVLGVCSCGLHRYTDHTHSFTISLTWSQFVVVGRSGWHGVEYLLNLLLEKCVLNRMKSVTTMQDFTTKKSWPQILCAAVLRFYGLEFG